MNTLLRKLETHRVHQYASQPEKADAYDKIFAAIDKAEIVPLDQAIQQAFNRLNHVMDESRNGLVGVEWVRGFMGEVRAALQVHTAKGE